MKRSWRWRHLSIQTKMLVIILPLIVVPMLTLGAVGFVTSSREAAKASSRYLAQRETDLRTLAESAGIPAYFNNLSYGLSEEAEVARRELERSFKRFVDRSNSVEVVYRQVRYVDPSGREVAKIGDGQIREERGQVGDRPFFAAVKQRKPGEIYVSPLGAAMAMAMPVYQPGGSGREPVFQGAVVLDFAYPLQDFQRTTWVILRTFLLITALSLGIALVLTITRVRRLTNPIRRLAQAAKLIAGGQRSVTVRLDSGDELGRLANAFNDMATSLEANESALRRKVVESSTLFEIGQEITARVALEPTLNLIVERARELLQAEVSLLALRQSGTDIFAMRAWSGPDAEAHAEVRFRPGEGIGGRVVATGAPVTVGDYLNEYPESPFRDVVEDTGHRAYVAVPLKAHGEVIGVLYVLSSTPKKFGEEDRQLLSALADQATIAIENARLYEEVRLHAEELEAKVEARTRELQEANRQLEAASRHKSEFLANMSHELRTPLNAIIGFARLVMRRSKDVLPAKQQENLEKILISADHLLKLINDILDLSKIEAGRMEVRPAVIDLDQLVDLCVRTVEPLVRGDQLSVVKDLANDLPTLFADPDKLKQILINLLSNAIKFTETGTVRVSARRQDGWVAISVADTGIGIPEDALDLIFEEFRQVDSSSTRRYGGTGLGLSICRHFARLMGGDIVVTSAVGAGSTFTLTLPIRYVPAGTQVSETVGGARSESEERRGDGPLVLAIDDDPDVVYLLRENLADAGYRVVGALSGDEGLQKARTLRPFAITLDIMMPGRDGWEVLRQLKADTATRDIPVIVVSIIDNKDLGFRLGAFDYVLKPVEREAVVGALARVEAHRGPLLVVDDDPNVTDMVRQLLVDGPYEVESAADGQEALDAIQRRAPAVILLDLLMPRMDGFQVIQHLQQDPRYRAIPVIVLTAKTLSVAERALLEERVVTVIHKMGLERDALLGELRAALGSYRDHRRTE